MLRLKKISLTHFKNYDFTSFDFAENVTGICGLNGKGKTNLLDAIYYCCFTKSYFTPSDQFNIGFNKDGFRLEGHFEKNDNHEKVVCINRGTGKKEFLLNDAPYDKVSKHIGLLPAVMIAPDDIIIITGLSEGRRKYLDTILCQSDMAYLQHLMVYNKVLQQRNSLLKRFAEQGYRDMVLLDILSEQLIAPGEYVFEKRKALIDELKPVMQSLYNKFSNNTETVKLDYESRLLTESFNDIFTTDMERDIMLQRTNGGIHKDDIKFELNGQAFKNIASQGQRKSLLFALKLAEFRIIQKYKGFSPLLLLDDVFEKLDGQRMEQLLNWVCNENDAQVFITDTHKDRLEAALRKLNTGFQVLMLD